MNVSVVKIIVNTEKHTQIIRATFDSMQHLKQ